MKKVSLPKKYIPKFKNKLKICLVYAPYYKDITDKLVKGSLEILSKANVETELVEVSGALEIPTTIKLLESKFDGFIAIGCIIRGETTHYEIVSNESARALVTLGLQKICIGNAILTVEDIYQAETRADPSSQDKGGEASTALLGLLKIREKASN